MEKTLRGMAVNKQAFSGVDIEAYTEALSKPGAITAALSYYRNLLSQLLSSQDWPVLANLPTLIIWGKEDAALGKELTKGTSTYVEDFQICYIPNCSHWVQQEQPKKVNHYIRTFLNFAK